jgi:hypothetical protein
VSVYAIKSRCKRERKGKTDIHLVSSKSNSQILRALILDLIASKIKFFKSLWKKSRYKLEKNERLTFAVLFWRALARFLAPWSPILL